ncbi:MAG: dUTP diphosphatase, partial [bacterium]|nr:dUTP diphosphatase [bacterium]
GIKTVGGVIDSGYHGDITVGVVNLSKEDYIINSGDKIAQILIQPVEHSVVVEVEELSVSNRGIKRYGSTGR